MTYASVHVDPGAGWFPHYFGFADETGTGDGTDHNRNAPLAPGTSDDAWLAAVASLCEFIAQHEPDAVVVSLGVDAAEEDPESPLRVSHAGFARAGELVPALGVPAVVVHEGGYHLPTLGSLTVSFLASLART